MKIELKSKEEIMHFVNNRILQDVNCKIIKLEDFSSKFKCNSIVFSMSTYSKLIFPIILEYTCNSIEIDNVHFCQLWDEIRRKSNYYFNLNIKDICKKELYIIQNGN